MYKTNNFIILTGNFTHLKKGNFYENREIFLSLATLTDLCVCHKLFHLARTSLMNNKTLRAGDLDCNKIFALARANPRPSLTKAISKVIG